MLYAALDVLLSRHYLVDTDTINVVRNRVKPTAAAAAVVSTQRAHVCLVKWRLNIAILFESNSDNDDQTCIYRPV